jgi:hypothetical protein
LAGNIPVLQHFTPVGLACLPFSKLAIMYGPIAVALLGRLLSLPAAPLAMLMNPHLVLYSNDACAAHSDIAAGCLAAKDRIITLILV